MLEIHGPNNIPFIGEVVTLNCTATVLLGVMVSPVLTLKFPNGTNFSSSIGMSGISVVLDPVHIADAGEYVCTGIIELHDLGNGTVISAEMKKNLTLKCKLSLYVYPMTSLNSFLFHVHAVPIPQVHIKHNGSLVVGSNITLTCTVIDYEVVGHKISVNVTWSRSDAVLFNNHERVIISELSDSQQTFISKLYLSPLSAKDANITCLATAYLVAPNPFITECVVVVGSILIETFLL